MISARTSPLFCELIFINCEMIDARLENLLFFSITFKNVFVSSLAFIFFNKLSKILSLSVEVIKGLLTTKLNSLLSFKIFLRLDKSSTTGSTSFFYAAKSYKAAAYLSDTKFPDASCDAIKKFSVRKLCEAINT